MTRRKRLFWISITVVVILLICGSVYLTNHLISILSIPPIKLALQGSGSTTGPFQIANGNLFVETPEPAVLFGVLRKADSDLEFTYIIVIKYPLKWENKNEKRIEFSGGSDGRTAECKDAIEFNGQRIETRYRIELDELRAHIEKEQLFLNGQLIDASSSRVFLYDLTSSVPELKPLPIERPRLTHAINTTSDVEQTGRFLLTELKDQIAELSTAKR